MKKIVSFLLLSILILSSTPSNSIKGISVVTLDKSHGQRETRLEYMELMHFLGILLNYTM